MRKERLPIKMALVRLLLVAALSGCQATQYQPAAATSGFGEVELDGNIWSIRFTHNAFTTRETAQSYWLYRAAELTISKGYDGFEVLSQIGRVRSHRDVLTRGGALLMEGEIRMLKKPFESMPPKTYNAEALKAVLGPYVTGATSGPTPVASKAEMPSSGSDELRVKMMSSIPCDGSASAPGQADCRHEADRRAAEPAAAPVGKPKSAPVVVRSQAPPVADTKPALKQTGPCEVKPVMTDQELVNCGARVR
ncbi:MAG: hypothetical protein DMF56_27940 [Acidobacteria bacterium]|nr:MAG: hypothetical protein DMF56_27940 [Acidobacteriota bacterium]